MKNRFLLLSVILVLSLLTGCSPATPAVPATVESTEAPIETETVPETEFPVQEFKGQDCFQWCQTWVPAALGFPQTAEKYAGTTKVSNYADALAALRVAKFRYTPTSESIVQDCAEKLRTDYDEIGSIRITGPEGADPYDLLYIKNAGLYYILDPFRAMEQEETWLSGFPESAGCGADLDMLCQDIAQHSQTDGALWDYTVLFVNTPTFLHNGIEIPVGTGAPRLSDEKIDALIATEDYAYIAEQITTLADCVNYFVRADFCYGDGHLYGGQSASAQQIMQRRVGQCSAMSTATNYLLWGDYDEVGYVAISSHAMIYILQDGIYYLVEPYDYGRQEVYSKPGSRRITYVDWASVTSSADFNHIAEGLVRDHGTKYVYTYSWPYSFINTNPREPGYPEECSAVCWIGMPLSTRHMDLSLVANDYFVEEDQIVMYADVQLPEEDRHYKRGEHLKYYRGW